MVGRDDEVSFVWFLAGLGLGTLMGVLYAPRPGTETREAINESVEEGREYVKDLGRDARESVAKLVERGKDAIDHQVEQVQSAIDVGREAYRDATDKNGLGRAVEGIGVH